MRVIDRLHEFIVFKSIPVGTFERRCRVGNSYFKKQKGGKGSIGSDILAKICFAYPELSFEWLLFGHGQMIRADMESSPKGLNPGTIYSWHDHLRRLESKVKELEDIIADKDCS